MRTCTVMKLQLPLKEIVESFIEHPHLDLLYYSELFKGPTSSYCNLKVYLFLIRVLYYRLLSPRRISHGDVIIICTKNIHKNRVKDMVQRTKQNAVISESRNNEVTPAFNFDVDNKKKTFSTLSRTGLENEPGLPRK